ncbi:MAG: hypothetical protein ACLQJR_05160 [Stellaceae bacterium]
MSKADNQNIDRRRVLSPRADAPLIEAGETLGRLRAAIKKMPDGREKEAAFRKCDRLVERILVTVPRSLAGAVVKLRLLADPALGIESGTGEGDAPAIRQILALVDRLPAGSRKAA